MKKTNTQYRLLSSDSAEKNKSLRGAWESLRPLLAGEQRNLVFALSAVIVSSATNLLSPILIARVVDTAIATHNFGLVVRYSSVLLVVFLVGLGASYVQTIRMGTVGRRGALQDA